MFFSLRVILQNEWLLLPCVSVSGCQQNTECLKFVERFRMTRASAEDIGHFALHSRFGAGHGLTHPLQTTEADGFGRILGMGKRQLAAVGALNACAHPSSCPAKIRLAA